MAGDWFPMGYWRSRCPEVVLISSLTSRDTHEVLGWLCDLWSWVSSESVDGHVRGVRITDLTKVIGADESFWKAVESALWLTEDQHGIVIPNWQHWLSESAKKRARERNKKQKQRSRSCPPKCPDSVPKVSPKCPRKRGTTLHNNTDKKSTSYSSLAAADSERPRNELFDALAEVTGLDPKTAGSALGDASATLSKADPPYSPDEVREFGRRFWELCSYAAAKNRTRPTPHEVVKYIGLVRSGPADVRAPPATLPFSHKQTAAEVIAAKRAEREARERQQANTTEGTGT